VIAATLGEWRAARDCLARATESLMRYDPHSQKPTTPLFDKYSTWDEILMKVLGLIALGILTIFAAFIVWAILIRG
jgi:hypothetical protein